MKTLPTRYGLLSADERDDSKMIAAIDAGSYPASDSIETVLRFVTGDSVVADIGANIGTFTLALAPKAKEVHSFEPVARNLQLLKKNIEQNNLRNVQVHPFAVGEGWGYASFERETPENAGTYRARSGTTTEVRSIDGLGLKFDVIKMDIQGMEGRALLGARQLLASSRPVLFFEVSGRLMDYGPSFSTLSRVLKGYRLYIPVASGEWGAVWSLREALALILPAVYFLRREGWHFDVLAVPEEKKIKARGYGRTFVFLVWRLIRKILHI